MVKYASQVSVLVTLVAVTVGGNIQPLMAARSPAPPQSHQVVVNTDGSFSPSNLVIREGDTVTWIFSDKTDSVVEGQAPTSPANSCLVAEPVGTGAKTGISGPNVGLHPGLYTLGPKDEGYQEEILGADGLCANNSIPYKVFGNIGLCKSNNLHLQETMESTWFNPDIAGIFVRLHWNDIQLAPGMADANYDFTTLDRELDQAVKHGKKITLSINAGRPGTPDWLFTEGGVQGYDFVDYANDGDFTGVSDPFLGCGLAMTLGNPTDEKYQQHYFDMIRKVGEHIKTRSDWYNAVAYFKLSGANMLTHENRLPNSCQPGCLCNTKVWSEAGYTPDGLYNFYLDQMAVVQEVFPGLPMNYALIQAGFPLVANDGSYLKSDGTSSGTILPEGAEQTSTILDLGAAAYGDLFVVQHSGLGPAPTEPGAICGVVGDASGCPNRWVLEAGEAGQPTAFQTKNADVVNSPDTLYATLVNLRDFSQATYLEIYEDVAWEVAKLNGVLVPNSVDSTNTLKEWGDILTDRRNTTEQHGYGPAFPLTHSFTFNSAGTGRKVKDLYFYNPSRCDDTSVQRYGVVTVQRK